MGSGLALDLESRLLVLFAPHHAVLAPHLHSQASAPPWASHMMDVKGLWSSSEAPSSPFITPPLHIHLFGTDVS